MSSFSPPEGKQFSLSLSQLAEPLPDPPSSHCFFKSLSDCANPPPTKMTDSQTDPSLGMRHSRWSLPQFAFDHSCPAPPALPASQLETNFLLNGPILIIAVVALVAVLQAIFIKPPKKSHPKHFNENGYKEEKSAKTSTFSPRRPSINLLQRPPKQENPPLIRRKWKAKQSMHINRPAMSTTDLDMLDRSPVDSAPKKTAETSSGKEANPFAPPFFFQTLALVMNAIFMLESILELGRSFFCSHLDESVLFYLAGCFSIHIICLFTLVNNHNKAPSPYVVTVWVSHILIECALSYLSPNQPLLTRVLSPTDPNVNWLYAANTWRAVRAAFVSMRKCNIITNLAVYGLCYFNSGAVSIKRVFRALSLGLLLEVPIVERESEHSQQGSHSGYEDSDSTNTEVDVKEFPARTFTVDQLTPGDVETECPHWKIKPQARLDEMRSSRQFQKEHLERRRSELEAKKPTFWEPNPETDAVEPVKQKKKGPAWGRAKKNKTPSWRDYANAYRMYAKYLWPDRLILRISVVVCVVICFAERGVNPMSSLLFKQIITSLEQPGEKDERERFLDVVPLVLAFGSVRILQGSQGWLSLGRSVLWSPVARYTYKALSLEVFRHVHSLPYSFHVQARPDELLSAINKGGSVTTFLHNVSFSVLPAIADMFIQMSYFIYQFGSTYARIVGLMSAWYIYATMSLARWRTATRRELSEADRNLDSVKLDSLGAYKTIKYFNTEEFEVGKLVTSLDHFQKCQRNAHFSQVLMECSQSLIFICGLMVACLVGSAQISRGELRASDLATLIDYMMQMRGPLNVFSDFYRTVQNAMINAERLTVLLQLNPYVPHRADAEPMESCRGEIQLSNVVYTYPGAYEPTLNGVNLSFAAGEVTALVGPSGGGKSTIFDLLLRLYKPESGTVEVDGKSLDYYTSDSYKKHIAIVPQQATMFYQTIIENIRYGNEEATQEQIDEACRLACIYDDIQALPLGYDTPVDGSGNSLSGGQKQRICLARAFLRNPQIFLFDEVTSALDSHTEQMVQENIERFAWEQKRTVLLVAHRLTSITRADNICVFEGGRVVERGKHGELLAMNGVYAQLWAKQMKSGMYSSPARSSCRASQEGHSMAPIPQD